MKRTLTAVLLVVANFLFSLTAIAQEEARAAWQVNNFDITANIQQAERMLGVTAILSATNVGRGVGNSFTFRVNSKAAIKAVTVGGASATFRAVAESQANIQRVTVTLPNSVPSGGPLTININYTIPVETNTGLAAISPMGSQFLPLAFWYPAPNTPFTLRGADTAPFRLSVNAAGVVSSGNEKTGGSGSSLIEQTLSAQPLFVQGEWDRVEGTAESRNISALLPRGASAEEKKQAEALIAIAASARAYYASMLGPGPDAPVRLIGVRRGAGISDAGAVLVESAAFRRNKPDSTTVLLISEAIARMWIGAQTPVRGEGGGVVREGLTRFLATLFIEKHFGRDAAREELLRERLAYSTVAKREGPLGRVTPLDATYFSSVPNKGAMMWRLIDKTLGRDNFMTTLRDQLQAGKANLTGVSLGGLRAALGQLGGERVKTVLDQQLDQVTDLDLLIGLPQQRGGEWVSALRNFGAGDVTTSVQATTATGELVSTEVTVPAKSLGEAVFKTGAKVVRAEIDPEKLYPQLDYSNDIAPRSRDVQEAMADASRQFGAQDYVKAESVAREILTITPNLPEARILLARALLGQNKVDEAGKLFRAALEAPLPTPAAQAWANVGLGEIALKAGQAAEGAKRFNDAVRADAEYAATLAARAGRIKAETQANSLQVDPEIKSFVAQLDQAITSGKKVELESRIVSGELVRFISGIIGTQPEMWQTRVLRTESLGANLMAADVALDTKELGRQQSGTAVLILSRASGGWKLAGIDLFEVR
ncbi:MAG TPA: tetratricopeptide repeat protein [Pyrinomonadaceae bacterium]|nr:tetratricopeptide repeat protein [Pyrinomonadaceae bacterium]